MNQLTDKALLLLYCLGTCLFFSVDVVYIFCFLTAFTISALNYGLASGKFRTFSLISYGIFTLFFPTGIFFFPVLVYDFLSKNPLCLNSLWAVFTAGVLFLLGIQHFSVHLALYLGFGICLGSFLFFRTSAHLQLMEQYKKLRDDGMERSLLLKEKNRTLLEKQNYEIYAATLKERNRIARDIHDNVGHMLSRSILMVGALKTISREPALEMPLKQLDDTLTTAMNNIRESVHDLHDESVNLKEVLDSLIQEFHFCPVILEYDMEFSTPSSVKYCFISIVKEALSNISRHSHAARAFITLREHPGMYQLIIDDNGTGCSSLSKSGIGLTNMEERVQALNGTIRFQSDKGFHIFIMIPKESKKTCDERRFAI